MPGVLLGTRRSLLAGPTGGAGGGAALPLQVDLVAYYAMEGSGADSTGAHPLTLSPTPPTFPAGKIGSGMLQTFPTLNQFAWAPWVTGSSLGTGGKSFHLWGWIKPTALDIQAIFTRAGSSNIIMEFDSYLDASGNIKFQIKDTAGVTKSVTAPAALAAGVWAFVDMKCDLVNNLIAIGVNNGAYVATPLTAGGTVSQAVVLGIGTWDNVGAGSYGNYVIDEVGFRVGSCLSAAERTALYNAGVGITWPLVMSPGSALFAAANSQYLSLANPPQFSSATGAYSVACWVRPVSFTALRTLFCKFNGTANQREWLLNTDATGHAQWRTSWDGVGANALTSTFAMTVGTWYRVLGVYDGLGNQTLYVNGANAVTNNTGFTGTFVGNADLNVGANGNGTSGFADDAIARLAYWNRALSAADALADYNGGVVYQYATLPAGLKSGLVEWWDAGEGAGQPRIGSVAGAVLTDHNNVGLAEVPF